MTSLNTNASRLSVMAAGVVGLFAAGLSPAVAQQQQPQVPQGWFKACSKQEESISATSRTSVGASTGQLVTGISLIELKGKVNRKVFQVTVPSGRLVPPGIGLQIDGGKAQKLDYVICFPDRCIAEAPLSDQLVATFKKGSELTLTSVNFQNQPNPIKVTLEGFTGALTAGAAAVGYRGPPEEAAGLRDQEQRGLRQEAQGRAGQGEGRTDLFQRVA